MAQELTARSMTDLEHPPESPRTPASPSRHRKFSFKLPHQHSPKPDRRHFSEEAASIPDIQVHKIVFVLSRYIKRFIYKIKMFATKEDTLKMERYFHYMFSFNLYEVVSKIFQTDAIRNSKLTIGSIGYYHCRSNSRAH